MVNAVSKVGRLSDNETTPETLEEGSGNGSAADLRPGIGFVVLWSSDEPERLGAWLPVATANERAPLVLGRGPARADDHSSRVSTLRQRPEQNELLEPFSSEGLSRSQLEIRPLGPELLRVENRGRRKLFVNGDRKSVV